MADGRNFAFCQHAELTRMLLLMKIYPFSLSQGSLRGSGVVARVVASVELTCVVAP